MIFGPDPDIDAVRRWADDYMAAHPRPDFVVGDNQLLRWFVVPRNATCNVYLHRFLKSDEDRALHDHPYDNASWILDGEYVEHVEGGLSIRKAGYHIERPAALAHRIEIVSGPATTLFVTGPRIREWGFHCPKGWVRWQDFVSDANRGVVGRGCGD